MIMADISNLIELMKLQHKEQLKKQDRLHAKQMAVLIPRVKTRDADLKHCIEAACDGAKGSCTPVASFESFDSSSKLWLVYLERFRTFLTANSFPKEKEAQVLLTNHTTVTYKLFSNLAARQSPPEGINDLSTNDNQKFTGEQFNPRRVVVRERGEFWSDLKPKPGDTIQEVFIVGS